MEKLKTADGSDTYYSEEYQQPYHTKSGAKEESIKKFVEPCNVKELAKQNKVRALDVCFGLGYNSAALIDAVWVENPNCKVEVVGLENDERILKKILDIDDDLFKCFSLIKEMVKNNYKYLSQALDVIIFLGDAREMIKKVEGEFDCVFLDPFSPKACPELWTKEFFDDIYLCMKKGGVLTTYSCARVVRDNLKAAGFIVKDGIILGRRGPSTVAIKG